MTTLSELTASIAAAVDREDLSSTLLISFVRMAEQELSNQLRVGHQVIRSQANVVSNMITVPDDWRESAYIRWADDQTESGSIRYKPNDIFFQDDENTLGFYTMSGRFLIFGGDVADGEIVELFYFAKVPTLEEESNWVTENYLKLITDLAVAEAFDHLFEEQKAQQRRQNAYQLIQKANEDYKAARVSGSLLVRGPTQRRRGFGG